MVVPGQTRTLLHLRNASPRGDLVRILVLGVTQHPQTTYAYEADGKGFALPFPLGTLVHPLHTCRDLGAYIEFQDTFSIAVSNHGTRPHRYAAIVITEPSTSKP